MKITERLRKPGKVFSFEFYPPKTEADSKKLFDTVRDLKTLGPDFISITNSSTGATPYRTVDLSGLIKAELGLEVMAHLTCIGHSKAEIRGIAERLKAMNIENILALRGDMHNIEGRPPKKDYRYASELAADLKEIGGFNIGGAGVDGDRKIGTLNFQSGALMNVGEINNGAGLVMTNASGTLTLIGNNTYAGGTTIRVLERWLGKPL